MDNTHGILYTSVTVGILDLICELSRRFVFEFHVSMFENMYANAFFCCCCCSCCVVFLVFLQARDSRTSDGHLQIDVGPFSIH